MMADRLRVLVSGASGLVGQELQRQLRTEGAEVRRLVRRPPTSSEEVRWEPGVRPLDPAVLDGVDAVVNLSGASVGRLPWTPAYRRELADSRIEPTRTLAAAICSAERPPAVLLSASAVGFYGDRPGERLDEDSAPGTGFFPQLVAAWEATAHEVPDATRVVTFRSGVVVATGGGMAPVRILSRVGLGTRFGSGRQHWPWISLRDEAAAIRHLLRSELAGPVNLVGPEPATSERVTRAFARQQHRPHLLIAPRAPVEALLGEGGRRLLFDSMEVRPTRLIADGFRWQDATIEQAVARTLSATSARG
ncbi:TIGR01777 family oxidoreductase [Homoserinibacter sp. YIM 151385]|uniref:TIGR01777 family oxidoreductase n=1 Tax=Homoserinibacter sp. YIM 151385 TaxID=2985506 RepID=UPI0022F0D668|nr:TIGR01777 family oxidoreductase [Homoserinibacter sp. YIM 151385]WBU38910.1 TIGR01777 family oxidoreductase [Homoserinibacter sp. YIM 151385]